MHVILIKNAFKHLEKSLAEGAHLSRDTGLMYVTAQPCQASSTSSVLLPFHRRVS